MKCTVEVPPATVSVVEATVLPGVALVVTVNTKPDPVAG